MHRSALWRRYGNGRGSRNRFTHELQQFDPNTFDPWVCWTVLPMLVNCSFMLLGWIHHRSGGSGGGGGAKADVGTHSHQSHMME